MSKIVVGINLSQDYHLNLHKTGLILNFQKRADFPRPSCHHIGWPRRSSQYTFFLAFFFFLPVKRIFFTNQKGASLFSLTLRFFFFFYLGGEYSRGTNIFRLSKREHGSTHAPYPPDDHRAAGQSVGAPPVIHSRSHLFVIYLRKIKC